MVAAPSVSSRKQGRQQGRKQGKLPKAILSTRISQEIDQELSSYWRSFEGNLSKSEVVESLLAKALRTPDSVQVESLKELPAEARTYIIFDRFNSEVEMGRVDNLYDYISQHSQLERFIADKCRIIHFAA